MKKLTLLLMACSVAILSFAAGGNITYQLNGGITNDHGWKNKNDMYMGLNASWNTFSSTTTTWKSLAQLIAEGGSAINAVPLGIPTQASAMALTFIQNATVKAEWQWLVNYMDTICKAQGKTLPSTNASFLRYNLSAFFLSSVRTGWPASADYTITGQPVAFMPVWKHAFAGPSTYDGTAEVVIPDPYREGYTFDGWYEAADFSGAKVVSIPAGASGDKTLYAKWIEYVPTIAEVWAKGTNNVATKAGGVVTFVTGNDVYIQDGTGGLLVGLTAAPTVVAGEKIVVTGNTGLSGGKIKLMNGVVTSKEAATMPAAQKITLADLLADVTHKYNSYMFELIEMVGLKIESYDTNGFATLSEGANKILMAVVLEKSTYPINTKIDFKLIVGYNDTLQLVGPVANIKKSPLAGIDPFIYPVKNGKYSLTNKWLYSNTMDNFASNRIGVLDFVRGMNAKDGKMYFVDRNLKQLTVVDGATSRILPPVKLASNIFTYENNEGVIAVAGTLPFNDIKQDNAGNMLLGNCITSNAQPFQVWKIDLATGQGTLVLQEILKDNPDFADVSVRFDAFGVYGDVTKNAIIMAANASAMEVYKWTITNGVAGKAEVIIIDVSEPNTYLTNLANPGTAPQVFPLDENYFYLDGNETFPTLIDMEGNVIDGFYKKPEVLIDETTRPGTTLTMNKGHNGLVEFSIGDEHFFLIAATNTVGVPTSSFRLFKWADANKLFEGIESLWTLPAAGMGASTNQYRTAVPSVEVDEVNKVAKLYLYTGENGYGMYEFSTVATSVKDTYNNNAVRVTVDGQTLKLDKEVADVTVYTVTGQLVAKANRVSSVGVAGKGVFVVKSITYNGETAVQKVIVK